jgi:hypothetical protein
MPNCTTCNDSAGCANAIRSDLGMATTLAAVALPGCLAFAVTRATSIIPRGRRPVRVSNSTRRAGAISAPKWSREFEDPIVLADGRKLVTLREAATYITKLPKAGTGSRDMADRG